jgi:hypothetical protein
MQPGALMGIIGKSIRRFTDPVRALRRRRVPLQTKELLVELNPVLRALQYSGPRPRAIPPTRRLDGAADTFGISANAGGTEG